MLGESEDREIRGTARLVEALQAHVWPDIAMKSSGGTETTQTLTKDLLSEDERLLSKGFDRGKDPEGESFEELFAKFADMKGKSLWHHLVTGHYTKDLNVSKMPWFYRLSIKATCVNQCVLRAYRFR